jgi:hypothetical protein
VPHPGEPSPEKTEARVLYDEDNLYVGFICWDTDMEHITINELRKDFNFAQNDIVGVSIDGFKDRRSGIFLNINAAGSKRDGLIFNDGQTNADWDGVWDVKTQLYDDHWTAEIVIPFKTLRFSNSPTQEWGMNLVRRISRLNEESQWSPIPFRFSGLKISYAGTLKGLENIQQGRNLKIKPFAIAGVTQVRAADGTLQAVQSLKRKNGYDGGFDAKYSVTPFLTLDGTFRTDFAQVEVDQQQVNLTRFNLFFPEKRDFFLENAGTFNFGLQNANDRNNNLVPFFSRRIGLSANGDPIPIRGGARLSGQLGRFDLGMLEMNTERHGSIPSNNYVVGRLKRNLLARSYIGALMTSRDSTLPGDYNRVYGADAVFVFNSKIELESYVLKSDAPGRSDHNQARRMAAAWRDDELVISTEYDSVQGNFIPDVGFIRRRDVTNYSGEFAWLPRFRSSSSIRNLVFRFTPEYYGGSSSGKVETRTQGGTVGIQFQNASSIMFSATPTFDRLVSPFRIRPDITVPVGDYNYLSYSGSFNTNGTRRISGSGNFSTGEFWDGHRKSFGGSFISKPNYHLSLQLDYSRDHVELPTGTFTTGLVGARFLYSFNPRTFLNAYFQYNAETHQVTSNIRFNIIHHPLSDLFIVYNDRRDTNAGQLLERAFIVKFTNLLDL